MKRILLFLSVCAELAQVMPAFGEASISDSRNWETMGTPRQVKGGENAGGGQGRAPERV